MALKREGDEQIILMSSNLGRNRVARILEQYSSDVIELENVSVFDGKLLQPDDFLDWLHQVDKELVYKDLDDSIRVQSVAAKLTGDALLWWEKQKLQKISTTWDEMRSELKKEFVPFEYEMNLYMAVLNLNQGPRQTVADYTEQFFLLANRAEWVDRTEQHKVWRYLNGLNKSIQNALYMKNFFNMSSAIEFAYKAEELFQRLSVSLMRLEPKMSPGVITFHVQDENTETVTHPDCGKPLLMHGSVLGSPPPKNIKHWCKDGIFWTRCTSGGKLCDVTFSSGTRENYVSEDMVTELNMKTEPLPNPFKVGGLLNGAAVAVDRACWVSFSIGSKFKDNVYCYMLPTLKTSHLLLGTPWLHDRQAILSGGDNAYSIKFKGGQTMLTSLPSFHNMCCTVIRAS